jgi:membrane-associated phospholipid phosphatase
MFNFYRIISEIGDIKVMGILMILVFIVVYAKGHAKDAYKILSAGVLAMFITYTLKYLLKIPRPVYMLIEQDGYRFPSGHATLAGVVVTFGIYYAHMHIEKGFKRYGLYAACLGWLVLVSYARLYLGVHILIDVVVGALIGFVSSMIVLKIFKHVHYYKR